MVQFLHDHEEQNCNDLYTRSETTQRALDFHDSIKSFTLYPEARRDHSPSPGMLVMHLFHGQHHCMYLFASIFLVARAPFACYKPLQNAFLQKRARRQQWSLHALVDKLKLCFCLLVCYQRSMYSLKKTLIHFLIFCVVHHPHMLLQVSFVALQLCIFLLTLSLSVLVYSSVFISQWMQVQGSKLIVKQVVK